MIVGDDTKRILHAWMHERIKIPWSTDLRIVALQRKDLSIAGAVAYTTWQEDSVFMHVCLDRHGNSRELMREAFRYPFITCDKKRVYGLTPITAKRALALARRLGFSEVTRTEDFVLQVMSRESCRWINDAVLTARS